MIILTTVIELKNLFKTLKIHELTGYYTRFIFTSNNRLKVLLKLFSTICVNEIKGKLEFFLE